MAIFQYNPYLVFIPDYSGTRIIEVTVTTRTIRRAVKLSPPINQHGTMNQAKTIEGTLKRKLLSVEILKSHKFYKRQFGGHVKVSLQQLPKISFDTFRGPTG